jgi:hypothetical protein
MNSPDERTYKRRQFNDEGHSLNDEEYEALGELILERKVRLANRSTFMSWLKTLAISGGLATGFMTLLDKIKGIGH